MRLLPTLLAISLLTTACATGPQKPQDIDDPAFVTWYKAAAPHVRTAFFVSLCIGSGLSRGSVDVTICVGNYREKARIRLEGSL
jgi:hypothetical protein